MDNPKTNTEKKIENPFPNHLDRTFLWYNKNTPSQKRNTKLTNRATDPPRPTPKIPNRPNRLRKNSSDGPRVDQVSQSRYPVGFSTPRPVKTYETN